MTRCARCCLHSSIRIVNLILLFCGVGMIIYSLWLEKKWDASIDKFPHGPSRPTPWFIHTFLGVGIVVCLSTIVGHIIANCTTNSTLCFYIVAVCCLLLLEVAVVVAIFFRMDWGKQITAYVGKKNTDFENFVVVHVKISRAITLLILVAQISVVIFAVILWTVGPGQRTHFHGFDVPRFTQSFLVPAEFPGLIEGSSQACGRCGTPLRRENARSGLVSYIKGILSRRFHRTDAVY